MFATSDLLFEIGVEELPASFVDAALRALPGLAKKRLSALRLSCASIQALGTPRRLALIMKGLALSQPDLEETLNGPPVSAAFKNGVPTKAAEAFAHKLGVRVEDLQRVQTPKGEYVSGTRCEKGKSTSSLLPEVLRELTLAIPFRKSMRWADKDIAFGRPIQWLVALLGSDAIAVELIGLTAGRSSRGHRFLHSGDVVLAQASEYQDAMRRAHVLVDPEERARVMREKLDLAAHEAGGDLIEDEFLIGENLSLVEAPFVIVGSFDKEFLELPERVILEVARGHQRYFGIRSKEGKLLPKYLSVVNTAENPVNIRRGNDRVMRARLADASFFFREDQKRPLAENRTKLSGIVFQKRLGTMLAKSERIERLARELGLMLMLPEATLMSAVSGAHLAKCDLVSLMVGEFPELQGEMGRAYALLQGVSADVADVIVEHYMPKGAADRTASSDAGALVAMADRLDTLVGCFSIGLQPTGAADPYALRRAAIGLLRTLFDHQFDVRLSDAFRAAYDGFEGTKLDLSRDELVAKLLTFVGERQTGMLEEMAPADVVQACLSVARERPFDAKARVLAIASLGVDERTRVGEVFKRATNIASQAPAGEPAPPAHDAHPSEGALYEAFAHVRARIAELTDEHEYALALREVAKLTPALAQYFVDVFVMAEDAEVRSNRLRLMRAISETCSTLARFELLGG